MNLIIRVFLALIRTMDAEKKRLVLQEAVKHLFSAIGPDDLLKITPDGSGVWHGHPITRAEVAEIQQEAKLFLQSKLWRVLQQDVRYQLSRKMFEDARVPEDMLWGQLTTYLFDVIKNRLRKM